MRGNIVSRQNAWICSTIKPLSRRCLRTQRYSSWTAKCGRFQYRRCFKSPDLAARSPALEDFPTLSCWPYKGTLYSHSEKWVCHHSCGYPCLANEIFGDVPDLLYLHRSFFARAISDHPKDPLGSPYGTSVIAAYRSAGSLVALMRNLHTQLKAPSERMWFLWTHMFSCAVSLASWTTRITI